LIYIIDNSPGHTLDFSKGQLPLLIHHFFRSIEDWRLLLKGKEDNHDVALVSGKSFDDGRHAHIYWGLFLWRGYHPSPAIWDRPPLVFHMSKAEENDRIHPSKFLQGHSLFSRFIAWLLEGIPINASAEMTHIM